MRTNARGYGARRRWWRLSPALVTALVVLLAIGGLLAAGVINLSALGFGSKGPSHRGMVAVPVSGGAIPAYTRIVRDHLWSPKTGSFAVIYMSPAQVSPEIIQSMSGIIGRVVDHDKPAGYAFTESDFLPRGTRPGLVAGIPAGKRAMRIAAEKIQGMSGLLPGDRFDVLSTLPIEGGRTGLGAGGLYGQQLDLQARLTNWQKQATVRVVVQNGHIVQPVSTRQVPVVNNTLTQGTIVRTRPVQEIVIAVDPKEVAHLTEAMAVGAELSCVPRSGRPDDPVDSVTPESRPWSPYGGVVEPPRQAGISPEGVAAAVPASTSIPGSLGMGPFLPVETISGTRREIIAAPRK
jgi:Flp pilus assembly protein CpaB